MGIGSEPISRYARARKENATRMERAIYGDKAPNTMDDAAALHLGVPLA